MESAIRIGLMILVSIVVFGIVAHYRHRHKYYVYGAMGSGKLFWQRLFCRHDWKFLDGYGMNQKCTKCGRFKSWR